MSRVTAPVQRGAFCLSLRAAARGVAATLRDEPNFRYQLLAALAVVSLSVWLRTGTAVVLLCCALVLASELFNSALERLADALYPQRHPLVAAAKDAAAGAVLTTAAVSVLIGLIVLGPALYTRLWGP